MTAMGSPLASGTMRSAPAVTWSSTDSGPDAVRRRCGRVTGAIVAQPGAACGSAAIRLSISARRAALVSRQAGRYPSASSAVRER